MAAVALILREQASHQDAPARGRSDPARASGFDHGFDFLLIRRAQVEGDPWSGQMALPGGRRDPSDHSLLATAIRETREEVGIDLEGMGRLLGSLSPLVPRSAELPPVSILPLVFCLTEPARPRPRNEEVAEALWVPLELLHRADARTVHRHPVGDARIPFPALDVDGRTVWGLTHRILEEFRRRLEARDSDPSQKTDPGAGADE